jgi:hypothetical protein
LAVKQALAPDWKGFVSPTALQSVKVAPFREDFYQ